VFSLATANSKVNLDNYTFEQFVADYKHQYPASEYSLRKGIFEAELNRVREHNAG
jgi:hypothetical protein